MIKKPFWKLTVVLILCLVFSEFIYGQSDEKQIFTVMKNWKHAIVTQDIDAIVEFYSENFTSLDGNGKEGVRLIMGRN
jgi:hypothetical protein